MFMNLVIDLGSVIPDVKNLLFKVLSRMILLYYLAGFFLSVFVLLNYKNRQTPCYFLITISFYQINTI